MIISSVVVVVVRLLLLIVILIASVGVSSSVSSSFKGFCDQFNNLQSSFRVVALRNRSIEEVEVLSLLILLLVDVLFQSQLS